MRNAGSLNIPNRRIFSEQWKMPAVKTLDWFWRGWFYGTQPCDISIDSVKALKYDASLQVTAVDTAKPVHIDKPALNDFEDINKIRNRQDTSVHFLTDVDTSLRDFYWKYDRGVNTYDSVYIYKNPPPSYDVLSDTAKANYANKYLYEVSFSNKGGLVMPLIVEFVYADGTRDTSRIAAQIWRQNEQHVSKVFLLDKQVVAIHLDPLRETADINLGNNDWPSVQTPGKFAVYKDKQAARGQAVGINPMQRAEQKQ